MAHGTSVSPLCHLHVTSVSSRVTSMSPRVHVWQHGVAIPMTPLVDVGQCEEAMVEDLMAHGTSMSPLCHHVSPPCNHVSAHVTTCPCVAIPCRHPYDPSG